MTDDRWRWRDWPVIDRLLIFSLTSTSSTLVVCGRTNLGYEEVVWSLRVIASYPLWKRNIESILFRYKKRMPPPLLSLWMRIYTNTSYSVLRYYVGVLVPRHFNSTWIWIHSFSATISLVMFPTILRHGNDSTNVEKGSGSEAEHGRPIASCTTSWKVRLPCSMFFFIDGAAMLGLSLEQSLTQTDSSARARKKHSVGCGRIVVMFFIRGKSAW